MHLIVVGLNHKTANVEIREKCCLAQDKNAVALSMLNDYPFINGSVVLSTCNRVEIYVSTPDVQEGFDNVISFLQTYLSVSLDEINTFFYKKNCEQAVVHLFKVASGIDSMIIGEYQIQGQVRDAYYLSCDLKKTDNYLNKLFQMAINGGKRVRSETEIGKGFISVASLAVELIKQVFDNLTAINILIVGAGKVAGLTASSLQELNVCQFFITNRSKEKAEELATQIQGTVIDYQKRYEMIPEMDVVIVSTGADEYTIVYDEVCKQNSFFLDKTKLFIDLSVPRNVDSKINEINNCMVYSIDDINKMIDINVTKRTKEIVRAEKILTEVSEEYYQWYNKQEVVPMMLEIKEKLNILKNSTIAFYKTEFCHVSESEQELIKKILDTYSDKLIKVMMNNIKNYTSKEDLLGMMETLKTSLSVDVESAVQNEIQSLENKAT